MTRHGRLHHLRAPLWRAVPVILIVFIAISGCLSEGTGGRGTPHGRTAVVTVLPQAEVVREVAGGDWEVVVIVPPGVEPHTYEPTASQIARVGQADAYVRLGPDLMPFEDTLVRRIADQKPGITIIDMSEGISLLYGDADDGDGTAKSRTGADPHIWLSPQNLRIMAENVARGLSRVDPAHADDYTARKDSYLKKIDACTGAIRRNVSGLEGRSFLVFHPAFGYFARDFSLNQVAVGEGGHEPGPAGLSRLVSLAREEGISVVFAEPQFSTRESEVIAREINGTVFLVDPLAPDVLENLVRISGAIRRSYGVG
ncbi:MAG: zinc ABC transporter substrate-binding protein [Methanolinea sp.]|nr:zinc ABC transporter substrate-binding protein [Methanolinea sp.]